MSGWLGLHNPEWHRVSPFGWTVCGITGGGCDQECSEKQPCRCCLAAEVETLRAQVQAVERVRDDYAAQARRFAAARLQVDVTAEHIAWRLTRALGGAE